MAKDKNVSRNQLMRMPIYLNYLKEKLKKGVQEISAPIMARELKLNEEKVRKDISLVSSVEGKPGRYAARDGAAPGLQTGRHGKVCLPPAGRKRDRDRP